MPQDETDPHAPLKASAMRRPSSRSVAWLVCVVAVAGFTAYQALRPTYEERAAERQASLRAEAAVECDRMAALYDQGKDEGELRAAHRDKYGTGHTVLFTMRTICPNIREVLNSDRGAAPRTDSSSSNSTASTTTSQAPDPETSGLSLVMDKADDIAALYGYTLPTSPPGEGAALAELTCDRAASGWDFGRAVADDISAGAPREAAVGWNTFVYEDFCPAIQ